jgi:DNA-binding GntR family transcriptional regulator
MEVVEPPRPLVDLEAAGRLRLDRDDVVSMTFRRFHDGQPFSVTTIFVPVAVGRRLMARRDLTDVGVRRKMTVLSVVREAVPISSAQQSITAVTAPAGVGLQIDVREGAPVLRIDRLYFDRDQEPVELAINHCNPDRYSYRVQLRAADR